MLYIIGLGLSDVEDVTVKGLKAIQSSAKVYLEHYTSILGGGEDYISELEKYYEKKIILADRTMVEQNSDEIIESARNDIISFLVVGDPFGATTHSDLVLRAIEKGVNYKIIHNASIMNAIGCCGLQLYNYGETISICFWSDGWRPKSHFAKICENRLRGLHTLCLLDIKVKEKSVENLIKGRDIYEPPRFMSVSQAATQLVQIIEESLDCLNENRDQENENTEQLALNDLVKRGVLSGTTLGIGLARVGRDDQKIVVDTIENLSETNLGEPLHSLVIAGKLHPLEAEFLKIFYTETKTGQSFEELVDLHNKFYV